LNAKNNIKTFLIEINVVWWWYFLK
jgi:hypothetical protein